MEEEDQEVIKHVCKFCNKGFPCGRSLGGHMRSHVTNVSAESNGKFVVVMKKKPSSSSLSGEGTTGSENGAVGYGLRENPKKTWRLTDSGEDKETSLVVVLDKLCKECGKGFQSWKALFGHMKCHSDKERVSKFNNNNNYLDDQDSCSQKKLVLDSNSDTEATVPNRRRRSKRRRTRYMMTPLVTSSSVSFVANCAPSCSSVSEAEQEQEEVALTLMMLSRDVGNWGGLNSIDNDNSLHFEALITDPVSKIEGKRVISNCSEMGKLAKSSDKKCEFGNSKGKSSELLVTESPKNDGFRLNKTRVSSIEHGKDKKPEVDSESAFEVNGAEFVVSKSNSKYTSIKEKFFDSEMKSSSLRNVVNKASESKFSKKSHKRGKFECTTCKRIFHSYQALGGHRASHKRNKGCFASRDESSENTTELEEADTTIGSVKLMKKTDNNEYVEEEHELEAVKSETVVLQESVPEIRNFLDLNLPAAAEEEGNSHLAVPYKPWWIVGSNHKQEAIVGLLSN